jgi:hypothetical protein
MCDLLLANKNNKPLPPLDVIKNSIGFVGIASSFGSIFPITVVSSQQVVPGRFRVNLSSFTSINLNTISVTWNNNERLSFTEVSNHSSVKPAITRVLVNPSPISRVSVECPASVLSLQKVMCKVIRRDKFGNAMSFGKKSDYGLGSGKTLLGSYFERIASSGVAVGSAVNTTSISTVQGLKDQPISAGCVDNNTFFVTGVSCANLLQPGSFNCLTAVKNSLSFFKSSTPAWYRSVQVGLLCPATCNMCPPAISVPGWTFEVTAGEVFPSSRAREIVVMIPGFPASTSIAVKPLQLVATQLWCPSSIIAGTRVTCTFTLSPATYLASFTLKSSMASEVVAKALNLGIPLTNTVSCNSISGCTVSFTPTRANAGLVSAVEVQLSIAGSSVAPTAKKIDITAGPLSTTSSTFSCVSAVEAGFKAVCGVNLYDVYGNLAGKDSSILPSGGIFVNFTNSSGASITKNISWPNWKWVRGTSSYDAVIDLNGGATAALVVAGLHWVTLPALSQSQVVNVLGTRLSSTSSLLQCPVSVVQGGTVACTILARDPYGNQAAAISAAESLAFFASFKDVPVGVPTISFSGSGASAGLLTVLPTGQGTLKVFVNFNGVGLTGSGVGVSVVANNVSARNSIFSCPATSFTAGTNAVCSLITRDPYNQLLGDTTQVSAFKARSTNGILDLPVTIAYVSKGNYTVSVTPKFSGSASISVSLGNQPVGTQQLVNVVSGSVSPVGSYLECPSGTSFTAGASWTCNVYARDAFGNVAVQNSAFSVSIQSANGSSANYTLVWVRGTNISKNAYYLSGPPDMLLSSVVNAAGSWRMRVTYRGFQIVGGVLDFVITGSTFDASKSSLQCPVGVNAGSSLVCQVLSRDAYGNVANAVTAADANAFIVDAKMANTPMITSVTLSRTSKNFDLSIYAASVGNLTVAVYFVNTNNSVGNAAVNVVSFQVMASQSAVSCPSISVSAGVEVVCTAFTKDSSGGLLGDVSLQSSLFVSVNNMGYDICSIMGCTVTFVKTGTFDVKFTPISAGSAGVKVIYQGSGLGLNAGGVSSSVTVVAAQVNPTKSSVSCVQRQTVDKVASCQVFLSDAYKNGAGNAALVNNLVMTASLGGTVVLSVNRWVQQVVNGVPSPLLPSMVADFTLNTTGTWTISVSLLQQSVPFSGSPSVVMSASAVTMATSILNCPSSVVSGASVTCILLPRDSFGNNAGSSVNLADFSALATAGSASLASIFFTPGSSPVTLSVTFPTASVGNVSLALSHFSGSQSATISVVASTIDATKSSASCTEASTAGSTVTCIISTFDSSSNPTGGASSSGSFNVRVENQGVFPAVTTIFLSTGSFRATFVANRAGNAIVSVSLKTSGSNPAPINVIAPSGGTIPVGFGALSNTQTTMTCNSGARVLQTSTCRIRPLDQFQNLVPASVSKPQLEFVVSGQKNGNVGVTMSPSPDGSLTVSFKSSTAGSHQVTLKDLRTSNVIQSLPMLIGAGNPVSTKTVLSCPQSVTQNGQASCVVTLKDGFGHVVQATEDLESFLRPYVEQIGSGDVLDSYMDAPYFGPSRDFALTFTPPSGSINIGVRLYNNADVEVARTTVNVVSSAITGNTSTFSCTPQVSAPSAGGTIDCFIFTKDRNGGVTGLAGDASLLRLVLDTPDGVNKNFNAVFQQNGVYNSRSPVTAAGVYTMTAQVRNQQGLWGSTSSPPATLSIAAGPLSAAKSLVTCPREATAGVRLTCVITPFDQYGNTAVVGSVGGFRPVVQGSTRTVAGSAFVEGQDLYVRIVPTDASPSKISVTYAGLKLSTNANGSTADLPCLVKAGPPSSSTSTMVCPAIVPQGATGSCTIVARDAYSNALTTFEASDWASEAKLKGSNENYIATVSLSSSNLLTVGFSPKIVGNVTVSVSLRDTLIASQEAAVISNPMSLSKSKASCTANVKAGEFISCQILSKDPSGVDVGAAWMVPFIQAFVNCNGDPKHMPVQFRRLGLFSGSVIAESAADCTYSLELLNARGRRRMLLASRRRLAALAPSPPTVGVLPGAPDAAFSTISCSGGTAGGISICFLQCRDSHQNPSGGLTELSLLAVSVSIGSALSSANITYTGTLGLYKVAYMVTASGVAQVSGTINNVALTASSTATILADFFSPTASSYQCPATGVRNSVISCTITTRDQYGNPSMRDSQGNAASVVASRFTIFKQGSVTTAGTGTVLNTASVLLPFTVTGSTGSTMNMVVAYEGSPVGSPHSVTVLQSNISPTLSSFACSAPKGTATFITCTIYALDSASSKTGSASDANSISAKFTTAPNMFSSSQSSKILNVASASFVATGLFQFSVLPSMAGNASIKVFVAGSEIPAKTGFTPTNIIIDPASASSVTSSFTCTSTATAGVAFTCNLVARDAAGNKVGFSSTATSVAAGFTASAQPPVKVGAASPNVLGVVAPSTQAGQYVVTFVVNSAGVSSVTFSFLGSLLSTTASVTVTAAAPSILTSSLTCPATAVSAAPFNCVFNVKDRFGNAATPSVSSITGTATLNSQSSQVSIVSPAVGGLNTVTVSALIGTGNATINVKISGQSLLGFSTVSVFQSAISASNSVMKCLTAVTAGGTLSCQISSYSGSNSSVGSVADAPGFIVRVTFPSGAMQFAAVSYSGSSGSYVASFIANEAGSVSVSSYFRNQTLGTGGSLVSNVSPGALSVTKSSVVCPSSVIVGVQTTCTVNGRDAYLNPSGTAAQLLSFSVTVSSSGGLPVTLPLTNLQQGKYVFNFSWSTVQFVNVDVRYTQKTLFSAAKTTVGIDVVPVPTTATPGTTTTTSGPTTSAPTPGPTPVPPSASPVLKVSMKMTGVSLSQLKNNSNSSLYMRQGMLNMIRNPNHGNVLSVTISDIILSLYECPTDARCTFARRRRLSSISTFVEVAFEIQLPSFTVADTLLKVMNVPATDGFYVTLETEFKNLLKITSLNIARTAVKANLPSPKPPVKTGLSASFATLVILVCVFTVGGLAWYFRDRQKTIPRKKIETVKDAPFSVTPKSPAKTETKTETTTAATDSGNACENCGTIKKPGMSFCGECGSRL